MKHTSVIIGYFGDREAWEPLVDRAVTSAQLQTLKCEVIPSYAESLCAARNLGAEKASGEQLIFLDADDELDSFYVEAMEQTMADVKQPSTLGIVDGKEDDEPVLISRKNLIRGNYIVIGAGVSRDLFFLVGGFRDLPVAEDWDLWIRCWLNGATILPCPQAIYRVHVNRGGRNSTDSTNTIQRIQKTYLPIAQKKGLV